MTIPIHQEEGVPRTAGTEKCCFCRKTTSTWSNDRDVACCPDCAKTHSVSQLPTKKQWVDEEVWIYLSERRFCNTFRDYVFANGMTFDQMQEKNITLSPYPFSARSTNKTQPGVKSSNKTTDPNT